MSQPNPCLLVLTPHQPLWVGGVFFSHAFVRPAMPPSVRTIAMIVTFLAAVWITAPRSSAPRQALLGLQHHPHRSPSDVRRCVRALADGGTPWLAVYGDSLARGIFFDTISAFNGSAPKVETVSVMHLLTSLTSLSRELQPHLCVADHAALTLLCGSS